MWEQQEKKKPRTHRTAGEGWLPSYQGGQWGDRLRAAKGSEVSPKPHIQQNYHR